jgi:hypothetical protein
MDVLLNNIRSIIHILDNTTDDTDLTSVMNRFKSLDMPVNMEISKYSGMDKWGEEVKVETLVIYLDEDVYLYVSKYFQDRYDIWTYIKRADGAIQYNISTITTEIFTKNSATKTNGSVMIISIALRGSLQTKSDD